MDATSLSIGLAIGAALGALVAYAFTVASRRRSDAGAAASAARAESAETAARVARDDAAAERDKRSEAESGRVAAEVALQHLERQDKELRSFIETSRQQIEHTFRALSSAALEQSTKQLLQLADERAKTESTAAAGALEARKKEVEALVLPIRETLGRLEAETKQLESKRETAYATVHQLVTGLGEQARSLGEKTTALTATLRGSTRARGRWGEVALRNVVEMAGMSEHVDFDEQTAVDDGSRPDFTVHLPGGRRVAVDAKAPLDAYIDACEATADDTRIAAMSRHAQALRDHVRALSSRGYWDKLGSGVDYVVLFLPGDSFLVAALENRPELYEEALRSRVILATPGSLLALLRTYALFWQQEQIAENAQRIGEVARELYARVANFGEPLEALGRQLQKSIDEFNRAVGSFQTRVLPMARKLEELGAGDAPRKAVPELPSIDSAVRSISPRA